MKISELEKRYISALSNLYQNTEAKSSSRLILEKMYGVTRNMLIFDPEYNIEVDEHILKEHIELISNNYPIQYLIGSQWFYGRDFEVSHGVLIPRPETEELVDKIIKSQKHKKDINIIDIGTGSGAISITLAAELPQSSVVAIDISPIAINIAKRNAERFNVKIDFTLLDILNVKTLGETFDVIVSNPPYITPSEKRQMCSNVLDYEPSIALFVPQDYPLLFYRHIAYIGYDSLKPNGELYFEINENFGEQTVNMLIEAKYRNIELFKDLNGKDRMIKAIK